MFKTMVIVGLSAALLIPGAWAQETDPAGQLADQWAAEAAARAERHERLEDLMMVMTSEMADIRATTNRAKRDSLMETHRENMREAMGLMRSMGGMHMRKVMSQHAGPGMKAGMDSSQPHPEMSNDQRFSEIENRMDMMLVMMESMLEADTSY